MITETVMLLTVLIDGTGFWSVCHSLEFTHALNCRQSFGNRSTTGLTSANVDQLNDK